MIGSSSGRGSMIGGGVVTHSFIKEEKNLYGKSKKKCLTVPVGRDL